MSATVGENDRRCMLGEWRFRGQHMFLWNSGIAIQHNKISKYHGRIFAGDCTGRMLISENVQLRRIKGCVNKGVYVIRKIVEHVIEIPQLVVTCLVALCLVVFGFSTVGDWRLHRVGVRGENWEKVIDQ